LMQAATLVGETGSFAAIVFPRLRPWVGLLLISFHLVTINVFGWGFHANVLILGLVFLPCYRWVPRGWCAGRRERQKAKSNRQKESNPFAYSSSSAERPRM